MYNRFCNGASINVDLIKESTVNESMRMFAEHSSYETLSFIIMVGVLPQMPDGRMGMEISTANPFQGALYFFIQSRFLCYCHEENICSIPGFDTIIDGESKCARVKANAESEMERLLTICRSNGRTVDLEGHFFQPMPDPPVVLNGDKIRPPAVLIGGDQGSPNNDVNDEIQQQDSDNEE